MGRWGYCLLQGDVDRDMGMGMDDALGLTAENDGEEASRKAYESPKARKIFEKLYLQAMGREQPDTEVGILYRGWSTAAFALIMFTTLIMLSGAELTDEQRAKVWEVLPLARVTTGFPSPISDTHLRPPGKAQFMRALQSYESGKPRNFKLDSCFRCGKTEADLPKPNPKFRRCKVKAPLECHGQWCSLRCEQDDRAEHDKLCTVHRRHGGFILMNV